MFCSKMYCSSITLNYNSTQTQHGRKRQKKKHRETLGFTVFSGGDKRDRTADLLNAIQALSQLSYTPILYRLAADLINIADLPQNVKP